MYRPQRLRKQSADAALKKVCRGERITEIETKDLAEEVLRLRKRVRWWVQVGSKRGPARRFKKLQRAEAAFIVAKKILEE